MASIAQASIDTRLNSSTWNLDGTPTIYVMDHTGIFRYRRLGIPDKNAIDEVLDALI